MFIEKLRTFFLGEAPKEIFHPVFGKGVLQDTYWECETIVNGLPLSIFIETLNEAEPTDAQVAFFLSFTSDLSKSLAFAGPLLTERYREWFGRECQQDFGEVFVLQSITVPIDGVKTEPWSCSFICKDDPREHLFTCYIANGKPTHVGIDG